MISFSGARTRRGDVMVNLKRSEMRFIDEVFGMGSGYVLDFSNRTFAEFFEDEFGINIYHEKYESSAPKQITFAP
jgi:hypothetical protein